MFVDGAAAVVFGPFWAEPDSSPAEVPRRPVWYSGICVFVVCRTSISGYNIRLSWVAARFEAVVNNGSNELSDG